MMLEYVETAQFPTKVVEKLKSHDLLSYYLNPPYGKERSMKKLIAIIFELGRIDGSLATFFLVQTALLMNTIEDFGSDY